MYGLWLIRDLLYLDSLISLQVVLEHCPSEVFVHVSATRCWELVRERVNQEIAKKHNLLSAQYEELGYLKVNMNEYFVRAKTEKKKESVIGKIKKCKVEEKLKPMVKKEASKEAER